MANQLMWHFLRLVVLPLSFFTSSTCSAGAPIVVGQTIDLSGPNGGIGRDYVTGIKTYFDMVNSTGGIQGRQIQYVVRDDRGQPDVAVKHYAELVGQGRAEYMIGGIGNNAMIALLGSAAFRNGEHILFAPLATAAPSDSNRILYWRPNYKSEIAHIFDHFGKLGVTSVALAYQESPLNEEAYRVAVAELAVRRLKLSGTVRIGADGTRTAHEAARLARERPGIVLLIADTIDAALFLKEYRKHDGQTFVAGTSLINLETLRELAGAQATEWTVFSQVVPNPNATTSLLQIEHLNMMRKFRDEAVSSLTLEGFAAAKALVKAIQQSKTPGRALHELTERGATIDLGGVFAVASDKRRHLSDYVDIALFGKNRGLRF